jgi:hypothetical protein
MMHGRGKSSPVIVARKPANKADPPQCLIVSTRGGNRMRESCTYGSGSSNGEGNRSVESLEVKAPGGRAHRSDPYRGASNLAGRSKCVNREAPKDVPRVKRIAGTLGVPSRSDLVGIEVLDLR